MVPRPTILLLALAASAIGAPAVQSDNAVDMKVPEQTPEEAANSDQGHVVVNVFGNPDVEPMCRANGVRCKFNSSCCSGYCSWHQGYKCVDRKAAVEEEKESPQQQSLDDVEPMCRPNETRCKFNSSCCSGYCSWHQGYKCVDRKAAIEEEKESPQQQSLDDVEPMCRANGVRCKFNSSCCSGYCSWHQGYKCVDRKAAVEEEKESPQQQSLDDVEPMCRPNGNKCRFNSSCCSGYCSWHQGYKCVDRSAAVEEEGPLPEKGPDVEPMCRPNGTKCRFNSSCCSGYCSWHQGYKCADRKAALEEGVSLREEI